MDANIFGGDGCFDASGESMNGWTAILLALVLSSANVLAADNSVLESMQAAADVALQTDPASSFWSLAQPAYLERDKQGNTSSPLRCEVRTRWTKENLYFLFISPYDVLYLKPSPTVARETNELWNWDVAEVFIGSDFDEIKHYKEFEVSPQGEWVDLDIDLRKPHHEDGWTWNSGFAVSTRIDAAKHIWYAAMRIPVAAIDKRPPAAGNQFRMNLFVSEGPPVNHHALTWQPPMSNTFHVPERFGLLQLVSEKPAGWSSRGTLLPN